MKKAYGTPTYDPTRKGSPSLNYSDGSASSPFEYDSESGSSFTASYDGCQSPAYMTSPSLQSVPTSTPLTLPPSLTTSTPPPRSRRHVKYWEQQV